MKLSLRRKFKGPKYTIGDLSIDGTFFCNTIEDIVRELPDSCPNTSRWLESFANRIAQPWWLYIAALLVVLAVTVGLVTLRSWKAATENPADVVKNN